MFCESRRDASVFFGLAVRLFHRRIGKEKEKEKRKKEKTRKKTRKKRWMRLGRNRWMRKKTRKKNVKKRRPKTEEFWWDLI